jgi:hypothetical protein
MADEKAGDPMDDWMRSKALKAPLYNHRKLDRRVAVLYFR